MANHFGAIFYIRHPDKTEVERLRDSIENKPEILAEIWRGFENTCVEFMEIQEYDEMRPNRIVLALEFRKYLPIALLAALEQSGFQIVANIYDLSGGDAWIYANGELFEIPNWLDTCEPETEPCTGEELAFAVDSGPNPAAASSH
jgi:hypothetical protein